MLGLLDDLILVPIGIAIARRMVPEQVLAECRARAAAERPGGSRAGLVLVVVTWLVLLGATWLVVDAAAST